jgi:hypothetical protein
MEIPSNLISLDDPAQQRMKISFMSFTCECMWFEINSTNNAFVLRNLTSNTDTTISIPPGNYTFQKLALVIGALYPSCVCRWVPESNTLSFQFQEPHSLSFIGSSYDTLGFYEDDDDLTGLYINSTKSLKTRANNIIYIRLNDVIQANENINLDNLTSIHGKPSNILCSIPVNASPFSTIFYDNSVYGRDMGLYLSSPKLNTINISLTDKSGNYLDYMTDWQMQLLVEIYDTEDDLLEEGVRLLRSIDSTLRQQLLMKYVNKY